LENLGKEMSAAYFEKLYPTLVKAGGKVGQSVSRPGFDTRLSRKQVTNMMAWIKYL
jgi:cyclopropane fatty-acyl-phospholipid synthase-like methyltransferase